MKKAPNDKQRGAFDPTSTMSPSNERGTALPLHQKQSPPNLPPNLTHLAQAQYHDHFAPHWGAHQLGVPYQPLHANPISEASHVGFANSAMFPSAASAAPAGSHSLMSYAAGWAHGQQLSLATGSFPLPVLSAGNLVQQPPLQYHVLPVAATAEDSTTRISRRNTAVTWPAAVGPADDVSTSATSANSRDTTTGDGTTPAFSRKRSSQEQLSPRKRPFRRRKRDSSGAVVDDRWSKRFFWLEEHHRDFVSAIFDIGLSHASPPELLEKINRDYPKKADDESGNNDLNMGGITLGRLETNLRSYRLTRMQQSSRMVFASPERFMSEIFSRFSKSNNEPISSIATTPKAAGGVSSNGIKEIEAPHDSFVFPRFTPGEERLPIVSSLGYLVGVLFTLTNELETQRAEKAAAGGGDDNNKGENLAMTKIPAKHSPHYHHPAIGRLPTVSTSTSTVSATTTWGDLLFGDNAAISTRDEKLPKSHATTKSTWPAASAKSTSTTTAGQRHGQMFFPQANHHTEVVVSSGTGGPAATTTTRSSHTMNQHSRPPGSDVEDVVDDHLFESLKAYCTDISKRSMTDGDT